MALGHSVAIPEGMRKTIGREKRQTIIKILLTGICLPVLTAPVDSSSVGNPIWGFPVKFVSSFVHFDNIGSLFDGLNYGTLFSHRMEEL